MNLAHLMAYFLPVFHLLPPLGDVTFNVPAVKEEEMGITNANPRRTTKKREIRRFIPLS